MPDLLILSVFTVQFLFVYWIYKVWNRRHEDIKEALACIDDLQVRVAALEGERE